MAQSKIIAFRRLVWRYYRAHGRHDLPWRETKDVYKILVSEVMLQQTQVERVTPFYTKFVKKFPTAKKLATAPLSEVLKTWQGLGYNRRAKMLHQAAKVLAISRFNLDIAELEKLPGVGLYTARAVAAFAYNQDVIFIETNIRTVIIHHFLNRAGKQKGMIYHTSAQKYTDAEIEKILVRALPKGKFPLRQGSAGQAREWYSALMDYGAFLKKSGISHNAKSSTYTKQSKFAGSLREARGAVLRELTKGLQKETRLVGLLGDNRIEQVRTALAALAAEKMVVKKRGSFALSD